MLATGDRPGLQLRGLADGAEHARAGRRVRPEILQVLKTVGKFLCVAATFAGFVALALLIRTASRGPHAARRRVLALTSGLSRTLLKLLNIRVTVETPDGQPTRFTGRDRYLLIANHISYLDVVVMNAFVPSVFVTSREIEATPVLGHVTDAAACAYVERRHIWHIQRDIDQLAMLLNEGYNVTLFPEGTTSPGDHLMEFKISLLESAVRSRCRVLPVCLRYEQIDGVRYGQANRDLVAWYGDMTFFPHFWKLMSLSSIDVRLSVLPEVAFRDHKSRKRLARDAKARIAERFHAS